MKRALFAAFIAVGVTVAATGCAVSDSGPCAAYNKLGVKALPRMYPLGPVTVQYGNGVGNVETASGVIEKHDGGYRLDIKNVPDVSGLFYPYEQSPAAIFITTPETDSIGFTASCISTGVDANNVPSTFVKMPTSGG